MENKPNNIEELFEKLKEYADIRINLFKLKSIDKVAGFTSTLVTTFFLIMLLCGILCCLTIALGLLIGELVGKVYLGFLILGGIYIIIGLVLYSRRDKIIRTPVSNKLIKELID